MMNPDRTVRFVLDGEIVEVADPPPTLTLLDYLRTQRGRTGTKEGCAEGDCGACTVVLGELSAAEDEIHYRAVNSCIRFLPTVDGCELVTVESLSAAGEALHPVQQAMVDHHASQCGFCTPGFVMSLFSLYLQTKDPGREQAIEQISGNLCRCTGYRPILAAASAMGGYPQPVRWSRDEPRSPGRIHRLKGLRRTRALSLKSFVAPLDEDALADALVAQPESVLLAGGTDIGLWVTKHLRELPAIIYIGEVASLKEIRSTMAGIEIGAAVVLSDALRAIVALYPVLQRFFRRFASPPVCNSGTLCGNIANGSPIGDSMPILIALGAELLLRRGERIRRVPLEDFYLGYQKKDLEPGEFVVSVTVPAPRTGQRIASYKVSKRFDQDISAVCAAFAFSIEGGRISSARMVFGGMAATPARARATEAALTGKVWDSESVEAAAAALAQDYQPLSDLRATSEYRLSVAGNLLRRFYLESQGGNCVEVADMAAEALS
jgi:xanthine dehydrogenase small subunit